MSPLPATPAPDFRSADVLRQHIADTMAFTTRARSTRPVAFSSISATTARSTMPGTGIW